MLSTTKRLAVSSDAGIRVSAACDWLTSQRRDTELLIIATSSEAAGELTLRVVKTGGTWFGIKRFTLNGLASRLAQPSLAAAGVATASSLSFSAVVARAVHSLYSRNKLTYFTPVASRPGFPKAVARTLAELRMNEIAPEALEKLGRGGGDLAMISRQVEAELKQAKLADRTIVFRAAIDALESRSIQAESPLLFLDVSLADKLESDLVKVLVQHSPAVLATVPKGDERTISRLEQVLTCVRQELSANGSGATSLDAVKTHLFETSAPAKAALDDSVQLRNWPGEPRECVEIVRSIQSEAERGVPFDQMAVLLNSPGEYRSHLEEAFARAGIPAYFVKGTTAPDPSGRALLALLSCAAEGLSAKRFAEYLSLGQVPAAEADKSVDRQWVGPQDEMLTSGEEEMEAAQLVEPLFAGLDQPPIIEGSLRVPARWERLLVDAAVIGGKDRWKRRLQGLGNELKLRHSEAAPDDEARVDSINKQLADLDALRQFGLPLIDRLAQLPGKATWGEWLAHLRELAVNALRSPEGVLATLAELEPMNSVGPVDLHEVELVLESRLHDLGVEPPRRRYGSVFVGPVSAVRGLSFHAVFVPGLAERIFPRKHVEDPVLPDLQRRELQLHTRSDLVEQERLALRLAVGAARTRVYLSYPRVDVQQSRPRVPSFYALEALRAAEGELPGFEEIASRAESTTRARLGWPAPERPEAAIDEAEYDLALLANLVEASLDEETGAAHYLLGANPHLARALRARSRRWLKRWTQNDGLVEIDELARAGLAQHQFSKRSFSATALQEFSNCPYRFFLSAILRFDLRQDPAAIEVIDPLTRGSIFHETLFVVMTKLKELGKLPLVDEVEVAYALVDDALERLAAEYEDKLAPAIPRVWTDGINSIRADLREYLRRLAESTDGWVPDKFELSFGLSDRGPRDQDPASVADPVQVVGDLKLRGSVDMVERRAGNVYRVTDYKTGKARAERNNVVGGGKYLQPLLYALACQELLDGKVESGRLYYCTTDGGFEERVVVVDPETIQSLNSVLMTVRQSLEEGFLPAAPDKDACKWCNFLAVCGSSEEKRSKVKPKDRLVQLKAMRNLP